MTAARSTAMGGGVMRRPSPRRRPQRPAARASAEGSGLDGEHDRGAENHHPQHHVTGDHGGAPRRCGHAAARKLPRLRNHAGGHAPVGDPRAAPEQQLQCDEDEDAVRPAPGRERADGADGRDAHADEHGHRDRARRCGGRRAGGTWLDRRRRRGAAAAPRRRAAGRRPRQQRPTGTARRRRRRPRRDARRDRAAIATATAKNSGPGAGMHLRDRLVVEQHAGAAERSLHDHEQPTAATASQRTAGRVRRPPGQRPRARA